MGYLRKDFTISKEFCVQYRYIFTFRSSKHVLKEVNFVTNHLAQIKAANFFKNFVKNWLDFKNVKKKC